MKNFIKKFALFISPIAVLAALALFFYIKRDVYSDFEHKNNFAWKYNFQQLSDISTKKLLATDKNYNSFIFGSSRSCSIYGCYLESKLPGSRFFHYANWNEPIGGILAKLKYLEAEKYDLKNVVIYLDTDYTFDGEAKASPMDHYLILKESKFYYYYKHLVSFFSNFSLEKLKILMGEGEKVSSFVNSKLDVKTNDFNHVCSAEEIRKYSYVQSNYDYKHRLDSLKKAGFMYERPQNQQYRSPQISEEEEVMIKEIAVILEKHKTQYTVVLTPLYDQQKLDKKDYDILKKYFKNNLHDFSGKNKYTGDFYNYPDRTHFQNYISKEIIDSVVVR
ncbi:hypothetical protein [Lacihabitans soyangensis]|uniref:Uncharacterized protein n=1 Tax=Lacihabitans soyangensis TaxID=869394 RepID=A0AAE3H454_9BACT|nr:hypothetical protein [Lacihabitans soyangensis]MCP9764627.1 hypothetical protein [Lacihabitans soyangensis]